MTEISLYNQTRYLVSLSSFHYPESVKRSDGQVSLAADVVCHFTCALPARPSVRALCDPARGYSSLTALCSHVVVEVGAGVVPVLSKEIKTEDCGRMVFSASVAIDRSCVVPALGTVAPSSSPRKEACLGPP